MGEFLAGSDVFAGFSAVLAYWLGVAAYVMWVFCYNHRYRFLNWTSVNAAERADASLNLGLALFFTYAGTQRAHATYSFIKQQWTISPSTTIVAPLYLPMAMAAMALFLWWAMFHRHPDSYRWHWCVWMWTGLTLFAATIAVF